MAADPEPPQPHVTVRSNEDDSLDEVVIIGGIESFHIEQMDDGHWWFAVYTNDGNGHHFNLHSRGKIAANYELD